jgi:redox-sensing transcriptional repressor
MLIFSRLVFHHFVYWDVQMDIDRKSITRLSRYKDAVMRLEALNFARIFSRNLADATGVSAAQVRKDFSVFGIRGNRRGGYCVQNLKEQINLVLGKDRVKDFVIVGVGNVGRALLDYGLFAEHNIRIVAGFDINPDKFARAAEPPILPLDDLGSFIKERGIALGIISVPAIACQQVFEMMVAAGIHGILNFAPIWIQAPVGCVINNVNLVSEFENLAYFADNYGKEAEVDR